MYPICKHDIEMVSLTFVSHASLGKHSLTFVKSHQLTTHACDHKCFGLDLHNLANISVVPVALTSADSPLRCSKVAFSHVRHQSMLTHVRPVIDSLKPFSSLFNFGYFSFDVWSMKTLEKIKTSSCIYLRIT